MDKELLLIIETLQKTNGGILSHFCLLINCWGVECDCCPVNMISYKYNRPAINIQYIKTIEVLVEQ
ncbi:hypothetical protein KNV79_gp36 [Salmonella phage vB_SalP_TR2]|uniref:Uncharacterized protein n=1 Tax=Salmonella phage vB_SalP_TR2 TaxID=2812854 RepID=A0A898KC50_9CAUD|nr:hypothetical protein KNV79_gp36 [Salmonella phage vB_SalP_TR2]QSJ04012.1 hypothetical protein [Salmonella phage vB_SalP_TR2]